MNRSFWIPVGWGFRTAEDSKGYGFSLSSRTQVLAIQGTLTPPFEIARVPNSRSPHIPEKNPRYRITWGWERRRPFSLEAEPKRLGTVPVGGEILLVLQTKRPQTCIAHKGALHGVYSMADMTAWTYCGETPDLMATADRPHASFIDPWVKHVEPTCKECLANDAVWCRYRVLPYEDRRDVDKRVKKQQTAEEKRLRLPTAYARVLDDDLFENPTYKPRKERVVVPVDVDETEDYETTHRDLKREAALDRAQRLEESKARMQRHKH